LKFFNVRIVLCGWHLQRNLVSHFNKVKNLDADLYQKILYLPFVMSVEKFNNTLEEIKDSQHISKKQKDYIDLKLKTKNMWAKCLLKSKFTGGVSTTSRVECLHSVQKRYFTSNTNLQQVFHGFRSIEKTQILRFNEEFSGFTSDLLQKNINSLKDIKEKFPEYIYTKICPKFEKGLNYKHESFGNYW